MNVFHGTPMERRQQAADAHWAAVERRERLARFVEIDFTAEREANEQAEREAKEKPP